MTFNESVKYLNQLVQENGYTWNFTVRGYREHQPPRVTHVNKRPVEEVMEALGVFHKGIIEIIQTLVGLFE